MAGSRRSLILVEGDSQARMQGQYCYIDGRNLSWKVWEIFAVVAESEEGKQEREDGSAAGRPGAEEEEGRGGGGGGGATKLCPGWHRLFLR